MFAPSSALLERSFTPPTTHPCAPPNRYPQVLTTQALVGTVIALIGTWMYTEAASKYKTKKAPPATGSGGKPATA
jgi:hypothetical protein